MAHNLLLLNKSFILSGIYLLLISNHGQKMDYHASTNRDAKMKNREKRWFFSIII